MATTHDARVRRRRTRGQLPLRAGIEFFRPLFTHWLATVAIVGLAVGVAVFFSMRVATRYEAVTHFSLRSTRPGLDIQQILDRRLPWVSAATGVGLNDPKVEVLGQPGNTDVKVVVSAPHDRQLAQVAHSYTAELIAWELGPKQRRIQDRYRNLFANVHSLSPRDPRYGRLKAQFDQLLPHVVTDEQFRAATATRTKGPEPVRRGAVAFGVGLLLALANARALDADERRRQVAGS